MRCTERLQIEKRALRDDERKEHQRWLDFCQAKLADSPEPRTFFGRLVDSLTDAKQSRELWQPAVHFHQSVLRAPLVEVLHCRPAAVVQYEEDRAPGEPIDVDPPPLYQGDQYFFDVADGTLLFLGGREYSRFKIFPNSDFELVRLAGGAVFRVNNLGEQLRPVRKIGEQTVRNLPVYEGMIFSFPGQLGSAEEDYRRHVEQADPQSLREWFWTG